MLIQRTIVAQISIITAANKPQHRGTLSRAGMSSGDNGKRKRQSTDGSSITLPAKRLKGSKGISITIPGLKRKVPATLGAGPSSVRDAGATDASSVSKTARVRQSGLHIWDAVRAAKSKECVVDQPPCCVLCFRMRELNPCVLSEGASISRSTSLSFRRSACIRTTTRSSSVPYAWMTFMYACAALGFSLASMQLTHRTSALRDG